MEKIFFKFIVFANTVRPLTYYSSSIQRYMNTNSNYYVSIHYNPLIEDKVTFPITYKAASNILHTE